MHQHIALVTLVVRDYDEAIAFYRDKLGFAVVDDTRMGRLRNRAHERAANIIRA